MATIDENTLLRDLDPDMSIGDLVDELKSQGLMKRSRFDRETDTFLGKIRATFKEIDDGIMHLAEPWARVDAAASKFAKTIIICGPIESGKTSFSMRYCDNKFDNCYIPSFVNEISCKTLVLGQDKKLDLKFIVINNLNVIDNVDCFFVLYDLKSYQSFNDAKKIVTDSGGLQREAFFAGKQCVTVLDFVVWPETMIDNRNQLAKPLASDIINKLDLEQIPDNSYAPFGDGKERKKIVDLLLTC